MKKLNDKQNVLKALLLIQTLALAGYTIIVVKSEGWSLFQVLAENIVALNWNGQFNLDFSSYLVLSGLWIMWRNRFTTSSVFIALVAMIIGIMAFAPYVLYLLTREQGDLKRVLIGDR